MRELLKCEPGISAECATTFEPDDPMFAGHFPGDPLVPGVILTEALAQTAGIAAASAAVAGIGDAGQPGSPTPATTQPRFLLSAIRQMKFFQAVRPGERITLRATKVGEVEDLLQFTVEALVQDTLVAAGQLVLNAIPDAR